MPETKNECVMPGLRPEVPTKSESTSITIIVGVSNLIPTEQSALSSCQSMTYTVGASTEPADHIIGSEKPESFAAGAVRALKSRLRSPGSPSSAIDRDASGDF